MRCYYVLRLEALGWRASMDVTCLPTDQYRHTTHVHINIDSMSLPYVGGVFLLRLASIKVLLLIPSHPPNLPLSLSTTYLPTHQATYLLTLF